MTTEAIDIRIREDGSRVVSSNIQAIGTSATTAEKRVKLLQSALTALGSVIAVSKVMQYADAWTRFEGLVAVSTKSLKENLAVQERLFEIAQKTGTSIDSLGDLYSRLARSGKELGTSQENIITFTDLISKSLSVQGTTSTQASGALMQLGQALGNGIVRAEEFNSVLEGAPIILQFVAQNIKGVDGSIAKLRARMIAGQLTSKEFFEAYLKAAPQIEEVYAKTGKTFSSGFTVMENALKKFFGQLNSAKGISTAFSSVMTFLAEHLNVIAIALTAIGIGVAIAFAPAAVLAFARAVATAFAIITAHPLVALATVIIGITLYLVSMSDQLLVTADGYTTLADVATVVMSDIKELWNGLKDVVSDVWDYLTLTDEKGHAGMLSNTALTTEQSTSMWGGFFSDINSGWMGLFQGIARVIDAIAGLITGLIIGIYRTLAGIPDALYNTYATVYNKITGMTEDVINYAISGINKLRSAVGISLVETVQLDKKKVDEQGWQKYGANIADSIDEGFRSQGGFMENYVKSITTRAQAVAKAKPKDSDVDLTTAMGKYTPPKAKEKKGKKDRSAEEAEKALKKLMAEYEKVLAIVDPLAKVQDDYNKHLVTLKKALDAGLVSQENYNKYVAKLKDHYKDLLDPLGKVTRDLNEQIKFLGMSSKAMEIEQQMKSHVEDLKKSGVELTEGQNQKLREQLELIQKLTEQQQIKNELEQQAKSLSGRDELNSINAQGSLVSEGRLSGSDSNLITAQRIGNMGLDNTGTAEGLDAQQQKFQQMYEQINAMRDQDLISEQTHSALKMQIWNQEQASKLQTTQSFLGNIANLQNSNSKKMARIGKAAAIAQAMINTYQSATSAYAAMAGIPYVGPALGVAAAAAAVAAGIANVQAIRKQNVGGYMNGGYTGSGGIGDIAGVVHGQEYVMDAQTTSSLGVDNLDALRRGQMSLTPTNSQATSGTQLNVSIINNGTSKQFDVEQLSETDVRIIARDEAETVVNKKAGSVVAKELANANSDPSKALTRNTNTERSR